MSHGWEEEDKVHRLTRGIEKSLANIGHGFTDGSKIYFDENTLSFCRFILDPIYHFC